ncbi:stalk domain-containing protein [Robertmurraya kyonggiensis]|nr:stalk domain-containing protein [Robertmurraya kyonggiensis]
MWRMSFTLLIVLCSFIGGMLFWQWHVYSDYDQPNEQAEQAEQELTVESKGDQLNITQRIEGLQSGKEYRISFPDSIPNWSCENADGKICNSIDENPASFVAENHSIILRYQIELKEKNTFLLNEWMGQLPDVEISHTTIKVIDSARREGSWIAGFPLKGFNELELIDYYVFAGEGDSGSLYWHSEPLTKITDQNGLQFFAQGNKNKQDYPLESLKKISNITGISVIFTNSFQETNGNGLMVANPDIKNELLERKIVYNYFLEKAPTLPLEEKWLIDALTSLFLGQQSNVPKGNELISEMNRVLAKEETENFVNAVIKEDSITPEILDELIGTIKEKNTHFFTLNKNEDTKLVPLYFNDARKVVIQGKIQEDIEVLLMNDEKLVPFIDTMTALGFEAKVLADQETILLDNGNNNYRFYISQNIFLYNEADFGLLENPLQVINGTVFIKVKLLPELFKANIEETENEIKISLDS